MKLNDQAFFYHSNCKQPGIVGIVDVVRESYADFTAFDPKDPHYDARSTPQKPLWYCKALKERERSERFRCICLFTCCGGMLGSLDPWCVGVCLSFTDNMAGLWLTSNFERNSPELLPLRYLTGPSEPDVDVPCLLLTFQLIFLRCHLSVFWCCVVSSGGFARICACRFSPARSSTNSMWPQLRVRNVGEKVKVRNVGEKVKVKKL